MEISMKTNKNQEEKYHALNNNENTVHFSVL